MTDRCSLRSFLRTRSAGRKPLRLRPMRKEHSEDVSDVFRVIAEAQLGKVFLVIAFCVRAIEFDMFSLLA